MTPTARHPVHDRLAELIAAQEGEVIADLGCGPGGTLAALTDRHTSLRLIGLDLNVVGLAEAVARVGVGSALMVRADLGQPLPLADGCVDVLVCHNVIELLPEPATLLAEVVRVLRPNGRVVLSHTDFAGLVVHGAEPALTGRILSAYATIPQPWMGAIDPYAARRLPGLASAAGLAVDAVHGHVLGAYHLDDAQPRLGEVMAAVREHARRGLTDLTVAEVESWSEQLTDASDEGRFCFAETALITTARKLAI